VLLTDISHFYSPQWLFCICQWSDCCGDAVSINRSIIDFNNSLVDYNQLTDAGLVLIMERGTWCCWVWGLYIVFSDQLVLYLKINWLLYIYTH